MGHLRIEVSGSNDFGPCECCGANSRTVWGYIHRGAVVEAAYFVQWTLGQVERHGANFDLIIGQWGDATNSRIGVQTPLATRAFEFVDAVWLQDNRIAEIVEA